MKELDLSIHFFETYEYTTISNRHVNVMRNFKDYFSRTNSFHQIKVGEKHTLFYKEWEERFNALK